MIDATFLETFHEMTRPAVHDVHGRKYSVEPLHLIPQLPRPAALQFHTLAGLISYLGANPDRIALDSLLIHVCGPGRVELLGRIDGDNAGRNVYATSELDPEIKRFAFDTWMSAEAFNIGLQALFVDTPARAEILKKIGTMKSEKVQTAADDGVTQRVVATAGIALVESVSLPNPIQLQPYRTFREIEQPESAFILRVRDNKQSGVPPECALFQGDGEAWRFTAVERIQEYLNLLLTDQPAETHCIPVII